jgi:Patatin-like phospholipase
MRRRRAIIREATWPRAGVVLLTALVLTGCASAVAIRVPQAGPDTACVTPAPDREVLVGVALSGGGSRAAIFGAASLEALGRLRTPGGGSVLEHVAYLSSVSGGSVAASYYASQKPPRETPVLTPEGALTAEYARFFAGYEDKLSQDFESALLFVFLKQLQKHRARRAIILAFDSSFPFDVGERQLTRRAQPFSRWNYDYTRIPGIMEQRASTYQALFFRSLQLEGVFPDDQTIRVVPLRHTDAEWRDDLSDLPAACRHETPLLESPTAVVERIAEISTRFWLASACDRQLLAAAAAKVVAQHHQEILTFLGGHAAGGVER